MSNTPFSPDFPPMSALALGNLPPPPGACPPHRTVCQALHYGWGAIWYQSALANVCPFSVFQASFVCCWGLDSSRTKEAHVGMGNGTAQPSQPPSPRHPCAVEMHSEGWGRAGTPMHFVSHLRAAGSLCCLPQAGRFLSLPFPTTGLLL